MRGRPATETSPKKIKRAERIRMIMDLRIQGHSLKAIAEAVGVNFQRVHAIITETLRKWEQEPTEELRTLMALQIDELFVVAFERAVAGDLFAMDRCVNLLARKARLYGVDLAQSGVYTSPGGQQFEFDADGSPTIRVEIVGNPEVSRRTPLDAGSQTIDVSRRPPPSPPDEETTRH
jgi:hypothetical protein